MTSFPNVPEPTEVEIKQANELLDKSYSFTLPKSEAKRFIVLVKELKWRIERNERQGMESTELPQFTQEIGELLSKMKGVEADPEELTKDTSILLAALSLEEMRRVEREINGLIVEYRPIPYDATVSKKVAELIQVRYGVSLNADQVGQVTQLLTRKMWVLEGLDSLLEECLDNLAEHQEIIETLDLVISKLKGS